MAKFIPKYKQLTAQREALSRLVDRLDAQGDFDANAPTIRLIAKHVLTIFDATLHMAKVLDALTKPK